MARRHGQIKAALPPRFFNVQICRGWFLRLVTLTQPTICAVTSSLVRLRQSFEPQATERRQKGVTQGAMGYEEIPLRNWRAGARPHGYGSSTCRLRHREVQERILPHLG
jgi:hypothetical protein